MDLRETHIVHLLTFYFHPQPQQNTVVIKIYSDSIDF